ncbi:MAG: hypothetical protein HY718_07145 [Planctomycetes bacterium]|nr:hypothetical protein [Planctomycetota bacterium]
MWLKVAVACGAGLVVAVIMLVWHLHRRVATLEVARDRLVAELTEVAQSRLRLESRPRTTLVHLQPIAGADGRSELGFVRADVTQADVPWLLPVGNGAGAATAPPEAVVIPAGGRIAIPLPDLAQTDAALLVVNAWVRTDNNVQAKDETLSPITLVCTGETATPQRIELQAQFFQMSQLRAALSSMKTAANTACFTWRIGSTLELELDLPALRYNLAHPGVTCDIVVRVDALLRLGHHAIKEARTP